MEHTEIVRTVIDDQGAYAFFVDEAEAMDYARRMHATLGPLMSRQQAHELVAQNYEAKFGSLSHRDGL